MRTNNESKCVVDFIEELKSYDINFKLDDQETKDHNGIRKLENVIFEKNDKTFKISNDIFFRINGLVSILKSKKSDKQKAEYYEIFDITDKIFYEMMKQIILKIMNEE